MTGRRFKKLANIAATIAVSKKCADVDLLDVNRLTSLCSYFLIATVHSQPQMKAVIEEIKDAMKKEGIKQVGNSSWNVSASPNWQVLDYGGLIVHIMTAATRRFYNLERIWFKAKNIPLMKKRTPRRKGHSIRKIKKRK